MLHIDGERRGPVVNTAVVSDVAPSYCTRGALIATTVLGAHDRQRDRTRHARAQLAFIYRVTTPSEWNEVARYPIAHALPAMAAAPRPASACRPRPRTLRLRATIATPPRSRARSSPADARQSPSSVMGRRSSRPHRRRSLCRISGLSSSTGYKTFCSRDLTPTLGLPAPGPALMAAQECCLPWMLRSRFHHVSTTARTRPETRPDARPEDTAAGQEEVTCWRCRPTRRPAGWGGRLSFAMVNSLLWRRSGEPEDTLDSYDRLVDVAADSGWLPDPETLRVAAKREPAPADSRVSRTLELREHLFEMFTSLAATDPLPAVSLSRLNEVFAQALSQVQLAPREPGARVEWRSPVDADLPLWLVTISAADLLTATAMAGSSSVPVSVAAGSSSTPLATGRGAGARTASAATGPGRSVTTNATGLPEIPCDQGETGS